MLEKRKIEIGGLYKHFKGTYHRVIAIARDSETLREKVVYTHEDTKELWVRDKEEFLSEVNHQKYKDVNQKYRFERVKEESKV